MIDGEEDDEGKRQNNSNKYPFSEVTMKKMTPIKMENL